jgi:hypothetical protein
MQEKKGSCPVEKALYNDGAYHDLNVVIPSECEESAKIIDSSSLREFGMTVFSLVNVFYRAGCCPEAINPKMHIGRDEAKNRQ